LKKNASPVQLWHLVLIAQITSVLDVPVIVCNTERNYFLSGAANTCILHSSLNGCTCSWIYSCKSRHKCTHTSCYLSQAIVLVRFLQVLSVEHTDVWGQTQNPSLWLSLRSLWNSLLQDTYGGRLALKTKTKHYHTGHKIFCCTTKAFILPRSVLARVNVAPVLTCARVCKSIRIK